MVKRLVWYILVVYPDREFYKTEIERIANENDRMREVNQKLKENHNTLQVEFQTQFCSRKFSVQTRFLNDTYGTYHIIGSI